MGGVTTVIRVVRQVRVANTDQLGPAAPLLRVQQQPQLPPATEKNYRCLKSNVWQENKMKGAASDFVIKDAIVLLIIYFIGISSTVLGAVHLNDCPAEKMLPKLSVILGGLMLVSRLLNCVYDYRSVCQEEYSGDTLPSCLECLNNLFLLAISGVFYFLCLTVLRMDPDTNQKDPDLKNYCDYGLYTACFYGCIIGLIFFGLMCTIGCIIGVNLFFRKNC